MRIGSLLVTLLTGWGGATSTALSAQDGDTASKPRPDRFAIIYNQGYGGDHLPTEPKAFERLVASVTKAGFNVILTEYTPWREKICREHDIQIFVDLLTEPHHVYKNVEGAQGLCESLRGNPTIYGYHLWSDSIGESYPGRSRDVANVKLWDPTHPVYVGTYRMSRVSRVQGFDLLGYYDFHWKRGGHWNHLTKANRVAGDKDALFLRYCDAEPGRIGIGNVHRVAYTIATSMVCGLRGYWFHYSTPLFDLATGKRTPLGEDVATVNLDALGIGNALLELGHPIAVYTTPMTISEKDRPIEGDPAIPGGLPIVPEEARFAITSGEVLIGHYRDDEARDALALASHNAYQGQDVTIELDQRLPYSVFDAKRGRWTSKPARQELSIEVEAGKVYLLRLDR